MREQAIFELVRTIIHQYDDNLVCIKADQNAPAPNGLYASIRVQHDTEDLGSPTKTQTITTEGITTEYIRQLKYQVNINFYRTGALDACNFLLNVHRLESVATQLLLHNVGWGGTSKAHNLSALQSTELEERANITLYLYIGGIVTDKTNYIDNEKFTFKIIS